ANPAPAPVPVMPAYVIGKIESPYAGSLPKADEGEIFYCRGPHADARGRFENGGIWVLAGSKARKEAVPSDKGIVANKVLKLQQERKLTEEGPHFILTEDAFFQSPSGAAIFVLGRAANGWTEWQLSNGTVLDRVHRRTKGSQGG
ncbi:MAG: DUF4357 domain-containing protein, partial [Armatimonadetes bacterium]|nr:DUF4357 domain-containing protein [Armatimonadota bacterium]